MKWPQIGHTKDLFYKGNFNRGRGIRCWEENRATGQIEEWHIQMLFYLNEWVLGCKAINCPDKTASQHRFHVFSALSIFLVTRISINVEIPSCLGNWDPCQENVTFRD